MLTHVDDFLSKLAKKISQQLIDGGEGVFQMLLEGPSH